MVEECGGIQWPLARVECRVSSVESGNVFDESNQTPETRNPKPETRNPKPSAERRLFADGHFFHPDGKAKFLFEAPRPMAEGVDHEFPFLLLTGRGTSAQWHTQTRTAKSAVLRKLYPQNVYMEIHPEDAARLSLKPNARALIRSRRGEIEARVFVTPTIQPGQVFIPMHYAATNRLTFPSFDRYSRQPAYKGCAVSVQPACHA